MPTLSPSNFMTLSGPIYLELREQLIAGVFEPGQRLKLNELAEQTGTSVSPVREALIRLVAEDSIEMSSLRAFAVPNLSTSRFEQIVAMRLALEALAAERAAGHVSAVDIKRLSNLHKQFIEAEKGGQRSRAQSLNHNFHFLIYENAKMPMLLSPLEPSSSMTAHLSNHRRRRLPSPQPDIACASCAPCRRPETEPLQFGHMTPIIEQQKRICAPHDPVILTLALHTRQEFKAICSSEEMCTDHTNT